VGMGIHSFSDGDGDMTKKFIPIGHRGEDKFLCSVWG